MCDVLLGVQGYVTKCDRGRDVKLAKNSVTYFMDDPLILCKDCKMFSVFSFLSRSLPFLALSPLYFFIPFSLSNFHV